VTNTHHKTPHKPTLTPGPSSLCATWNCIHVPRPLNSPHVRTVLRPARRHQLFPHNLVIAVLSVPKSVDILY